MNAKSASDNKAEQRAAQQPAMGVRGPHQPAAAPIVVRQAGTASGTAQQTAAKRRVS